MNILMMTNTYKPLLGGLEKSVEAFTMEYRKRGHRVIIVAPEFENMEKEEDVIRIPAMQNFQGSDFSVQLPVPGVLADALGDFRADIVHAHHPFLVGDTALRLAYKYNSPLIFTHHTLFEQNMHYLPGNSEGMKQFILELSTGFANLADQVFAPSESVRRLLRQRRETTPIEAAPTGIDVKTFLEGNGKKFREDKKIPASAFVVGNVGRLAPEKNLEFVARSVARFLKQNSGAYFLVGGKGVSEEVLKSIFETEGVFDRLCMAGVLTGQELVDAYHAMDVFAFASQSETQGIVLTEAMAARVPIVGVDAPGVRDVVNDGANGFLLKNENEEDFAAALEEMAGLGKEKITQIKNACLETAKVYSMENCAEHALRIYLSLILKDFVRRQSEDSPWAQTARLIKAQWDLTKNLTKATAGALLTKEPETKKKSESVKEGYFDNPMARKRTHAGRSGGNYS